MMLAAEAALESTTLRLTIRGPPFLALLIFGHFTDWGKLLAWDPPHRVTFSWHLGPGHDQSDWVCDPDIAKASEVDIRFTAEGPGKTLVELQHGELERHGEGYEKLRDLFDGPGAWGHILGLFAKAADGGI